jgi:dimethylhistidine N-methyltransferase
MKIHDLHHPEENFLAEVTKGLLQDKKYLPPKFFYNELGSDLFHQITQLPEYYPTRTELSILNDQKEQIAATLPENPIIVEYGCGSSEKIIHLLKALRNPHTYLGIDISREHLIKLAEGINQAFPQLEVIALCADFTRPLSLPLNGQHDGYPKLAFFPGSSIGNFEPESAKNFLAIIGKSLGPESGLLIGVDLKKPSELLNQAYNDNQGITARFNKNILKRINDELGGGFELSQFRHKAFYNSEKGRVEMHLESLGEQSVTIQGLAIDFREGETIHTENSYKFQIEEFQSLAQEAGWQANRVWTDPNRLFSLQYFTR